MNQKYTRRNTAAYLIKDGWQFSHKMIILQVSEAVMNALAPTALVILPSMVIDQLTNHVLLSLVLRNIILMFIVYGIIQTGSTYLTNRNMHQYIPWRFSKWNMVINASVQSDYEQYMKAESETAIQAAEVTLGSNTMGMEGFQHDLTKVLSYILEIILYAVLISTADIHMILVMAGLSIFSYFLYEVINRKYINSFDRIYANQIHVNYFRNLPYKTSCGKDIRLYQMQNLLRRLFMQVNRKTVHLQALAEKYHMYANLTTNGITFIRDVICYGYLLVMLRNGSFTAAEFVLYLSVFTAFSDRFIRLSDSLAHLNQDLDQTNSMLAGLNSMKPHEGSRMITHQMPDIVFDHVTFSYPGSDRKVLDDFSLHIHPGEKIALVGVNGAGKTTIVRMLCKLLHPDSGHIYVNGTDLEKADGNSWRKQLGVIFQNSPLFSFTIGENISGLPEDRYDEKVINDALKASGLKEYIDSLPNGVHTYIGKDIDENGIDLSGGQKQKLLLARAWYKQPSFLILDEPTAALDAISEQNLYEQYNVLTADKGSLFISHRLASTRFCTRIILLKDGKIAEEGSHEDLMKKNGYYHHMFEVQSKYYQEGENTDDIQNHMAENPQSL